MSQTGSKSAFFGRFFFFVNFIQKSFLRTYQAPYKFQKDDDALSKVDAKISADTSTTPDRAAINQVQLELRAFSPDIPGHILANFKWSCRVQITMSEAKALRPVLHIGKPPTSPPPAKLLISHGKPNFTIKKTSKSKLNQAINEQNENEFSRVHQKISRSISSEKSPKIIRNNSEVTYFTQVKLKPVAVPNGVAEPKMKVSKAYSYGTIERNRVMTVKDTDQVDNGNVVTNGNAMVNGIDHHESPKVTLAKPEIKAKPEHLLNRTQQMNGNHKIPTPPPLPKTPPFKRPVLPTNIRNGNFEQKTVVSFSKELADGVNRFPDTARVIKPPIEITPNELAKELSKLKFKIRDNGESVVPVVKSDTE